MAEKYTPIIEERITELGVEKLRVYIHYEGVDRHYRQHIEDTFRDAGVRFVSSRKEANLVFAGNGSPSYGTGQVVAFSQLGPACICRRTNGKHRKLSH
jgi:hypothetical protein